MVKHKQRRYTKTLLAIILIAGAGLLDMTPTYAAGMGNTSDRLVVIHGRVLNAFTEGRYKEIKRAKIFYGYGWLDEHNVFVAYQKGRGEAVAAIEVIDLHQNQTTVLMTIGGVGDSNFDINTSTGDIVYNDSSGIHILKINTKTKSYQINDIQKGLSCWGVFWIDNKMAGCLVFDEKGTKFVKFSVQ